MIPRMVIAAAILAAFFVVELTTALLINSIALLADAGHMLTDVVAVFIGLAAVVLASSVFVLLELEYPFVGFITVSSAPLRDALAHMSE